MDIFSAWRAGDRLAVGVRVPPKNSNDVPNIPSLSRQLFNTGCGQAPESYCRTEPPVRPCTPPWARNERRMNQNETAPPTDPIPGVLAHPYHQSDNRSILNSIKRGPSLVSEETHEYQQDSTTPLDDPVRTAAHLRSKKILASLENSNYGDPSSLFDTLTALQSDGPHEEPVQRQLVVYPKSVSTITTRDTICHAD